MAGVLRANLLAADPNSGPADPTYLYYNPKSTAAPVKVTVSAKRTDIYNVVTHSFIARNVTGPATVRIPAGQADILVLVPHGGHATVTGSRLAVAGITIDYAYPD